MITQRPDLFAVALPTAGMLDILRFHRFTVGQNWADETGTADDAEMFPFSRSYSPLHNVKPGACYPATMVITGDLDDRVVPAHSFKFAAALQAVEARVASCNRPVLLYVAKGVSHSGGASPAAVMQRAAERAFAARQLGMDDARAARSRTRVRRAT